MGQETLVVIIMRTPLLSATRTQNCKDLQMDASLTVSQEPKDTKLWREWTCKWTMKLALLGRLSLSEQILRAQGGWSVWPVHEWCVVPTACPREHLFSAGLPPGALDRASVLPEHLQIASVLP